MAMSINALVKAILIARGAVLYLVLEQKVQAVPLDATV